MTAARLPREEYLEVIQRARIGVDVAERSLNAAVWPDVALWSAAARRCREASAVVAELPLGAPSWTEALVVIADTLDLHVEACPPSVGQQIPASLSRLVGWAGSYVAPIRRRLDRAFVGEVLDACQEQIDRIEEFCAEEEPGHGEAPPDVPIPDWIGCIPSALETSAVAAVLPDVGGALRLAAARIRRDRAHESPGVRWLAVKCWADLLRSAIDDAARCTVRSDGLPGGRLVDDEIPF